MREHGPVADVGAARRRKRLWGMLVMVLFFSLVVVLPANIFAAKYANVTGRPSVPLPLLFLASFLWLIVCYTALQVILHAIHRYHVNRMSHPLPERPNMFENALDALDRIASGDYNVEVEEDERFLYSSLAVKVNKLARDLCSVERMRQEFVSNVSHEIQSPLTSISGFAALLQKEEMSCEQRRHYAEIIEAESRRLSKLSDNLLKLSTLDCTQTLEMHPFRLDKQLEGVLLMLEPQWSEKDLEPDIVLEKVTCTGDEDLLSQVWINLLHNAIKFTEPGGVIRVGLREAKGQAVCTIADTGIGIPEESLVRIFERFYKVDKARDRSMGGNGLGTSLAKKIVDLHGGRIGVESTEGEGTVFTVTLPLRESAL